MINTLVSLNADLASSIALRYACRLTEFADMRLQAIHVKEVENEGYPPGSGWVRSTWEQGLLQTAEGEISQLINTEKSSCPPLNPPIIRIGDREEELLREIQKESYDLFMEGVLSSFDSHLFNLKFRSKLYKYVPCPILLVKNLVTLSRVALLIGDSQDVTPVVSAFLKIFENSRLTVDLVYFTVKKGDQTGFKKKITDPTVPALETVHRVIDDAKSLLAEHGRTAEESWIVQDRPKEIGEMLGDYCLVGARVPNSGSSRSVVMELLSRVPSATLLCK